MAYPKKTSLGSFYNPQYSALNSQIERETQALLEERARLRDPSRSAGYTEQPYLQRNDSGKNLISFQKNQQHHNSNQRVITERIKELQDLCRSENLNFNDELASVINKQKDAYDLISPIGKPAQLAQKNSFYAQNPIFQAQKQSSIAPGSRNTNSEPKSQVRQAIEKNPKIQATDEIIQMIEEIEGKALHQIEILREEKISLMKQLKNEIQLHNELQKEVNNFAQSDPRRKTSAFGQPMDSDRNYTPHKMYQDSAVGSKNLLQNQSPNEDPLFNQIRKEMESIRAENEQMRANLQQNQNIPSQQLHESKQQLINRIVFLENEVRSRDNTISELLREINSQGINSSNLNNPQLAQLLEQGEVIRQNTIALLNNLTGGYQSQGRSRTNNFDNSNMEKVHELEMMLEKEEEQKQSFLNDLLAFKAKYEKLEEENQRLRNDGHQRNYSSTGIGGRSSYTQKQRFSKYY